MTHTIGINHKKYLLDSFGTNKKIIVNISSNFSFMGQSHEADGATPLCVEGTLITECIRLQISL